MVARALVLGLLGGKAWKAVPAWLGFIWHGLLWVRRLTLREGVHKYRRAYGRRWQRAACKSCTESYQVKQRELE